MLLYVWWYVMICMTKDSKDNGDDDDSKDNFDNSHGDVNNYDYIDT